LSPKKWRGEISLLDILDLDKLQDMQDAVADVFGFGSVILDESGDAVTYPSKTTDACRLTQSKPLGQKGCFWFQRSLGEKSAKNSSPAYKRCKSCGLFCGAVPIIIDEKHVATWIVGQVKIHEYDEPDLVESAESIGVPAHLLLASYRAAPTKSQSHVEMALELIWQVAQDLAALGHANAQLPHNVVERKRADRQLKLTWHALDLTDRVVIFVDSRGRCIASNECASRVLGYSRVDMLELSIKDLTAADLEESTLTDDASSERPCETCFRRKDGTEFTATWSVSKIPIEDGTYRCLEIQPLDSSYRTAAAVDSASDQMTTT